MVNVRKYKTLRKMYVSKDIKKLKKDVNVLKKSNETKYHDESQARVGISYLVNHSSILIDPVRGDGISNRIGDSISPFAIEIRGLIESGSLSTLVAQMRIVLVQSKQGFIPSTTATTTTQQVMDLNNTDDVVNSPYEWENRKHFTVKYDQTFTLDASSNEFGTGNRKFHIKTKLSKVLDFGQNTILAERGQCYLLVFSNQSTAANQPIISWVSRALYKD